MTAPAIQAWLPLSESEALSLGGGLEEDSVAVVAVGAEAVMGWPGVAVMEWLGVALPWEG
jgi:hypothetical protein